MDSLNDTKALTFFSFFYLFFAFNINLYRFLFIGNCHSGLISKYNIGLKTLLHRGLLEPEFYGNLVHKFHRIVAYTKISE